MKKYQSVVVSGLFAFIGVTILALLTRETDYTLLVAPFGATFLLIGALPESPLARPRNIIGGYLIAGAIGVAAFQLFGNAIWVAGFGVGASVIAMQYAKMVHPPAGAVPLLTLTTEANWGFMFTPILVGSILLAGFALLYKYEHRTEHVEL